MKTAEELAQEREYRTVSYLISTLANMCAGSPNNIIDLLTGDQFNIVKCTNFERKK